MTIRLCPIVALAALGLLAPLLVGPADADEKLPSGKSWYARFPGSSRVDDLEPAFREKVQAFLKAVRDAGATVSVNSTRRPPERAYLMHWCWMIVTKDQDASKVPAMAGVDINWWHGDQATSKKKAEEMVNAFGMRNLKVAPALKSRHIEGKAIDADISWKGTLTLREKDGTMRKIESGPRDSTNADLIAVAATYGVIHYIDAPKDRVHWSTDGR